MVNLEYNYSHNGGLLINTYSFIIMIINLSDLVQVFLLLKEVRKANYHTFKNDISIGRH